MRSWLKGSPKIYGLTLRPRRFTPWAIVYFILFFCLPFLGFCLALDLIFYLIYTHLFDTCYGVLCWTG